jgi:hypothetical protein
MDRRSRLLRPLPLFVALGVLAMVLSRCGQNYPLAPARSFQDVDDIVKKSNGTDPKRRRA